MNIMQLEEERRQEIVQSVVYDSLLRGLALKIKYHHSPEVRTPQVLLQKPVFVRLLKHDTPPSDKTLSSLLGKDVKGYRVIAAVRDESLTPGVSFTLCKL